MSTRRVRRPFGHRSANERSLRSLIEPLECRALLSTLPVAQPTYRLRASVADPTPPSGSFTPAQIQQAYQFNQVSYNGSGETIGIVDAYNDPDIQSDLNTFDAEYNLPSTTVSVVNETGGSSLPGADPTGGWEMEESLDVEWAHAMAPGANILLVEASSDDVSDLLDAVKYAGQHANVVSMSWGASEFSGETSDDGDFSVPGVAFVAASGDSGAPAEWPAASPNVLGVGGTSLTLNSSGGWGSETGWSGSGGGPSAYEPQPSYQAGVVETGTTKRATPDVAYDASSTGTYSVYDSYPYEVSYGDSESLGWVAVYGTSAGSPQWSAILAIADQGRAAAGLSALNSSSAQQVMDILYENPGDFHDITTGTSTGDPNYSAGPGYDYVTGMGTPIVNLIVGSLDGSSSTTPPDTMVISAPSTVTAGTSFTYTVTAENASGEVDTGFTGTIRFTSTDSKIQGLPSSYTFTTADDGVADFTVTLETAGSQTITETSASGSVVSTIAVSPAAASELAISGPSTATAGTSESFTVTAYDAYGNVATGYGGTVAFSSSDTAATLPGDTTFDSADAGKVTVSVKFNTAGTQSLTVQDTVNSSLTATQSGIGVSPAAPTGLAAVAASSSQINLTWNASDGATGYEIERSLSATSGWAEVGTSTTTSYSDTGLTAGTTYYYQVIATGGGKSSAASNTASATTTGTPPVPSGSESIWGTSYSPTVNSYYDGSPGQTFELGVQFESNVGGEVTGVLFYKQAGMSGTNVGHLWSSNGTLLASATFTNETRSGWQSVTFAQPVQIQANTIYTVSYTTGSPLFYFESGYFSKGGVTNDNLTAPASTDIDGRVLDNGVYNYGGYFPVASEYWANFWVDLKFSPTTGSSGSVKTGAVAGATGGSPAIAIGPSAYPVNSAASATPAGPMGVVPGRPRATSSTARQPSVSLAVTPYRPVVTQARAPVLWGRKSTSSLS